MSDTTARPVHVAFEGIVIPESLLASVARHTADLAKLIGNLKSAGMSGVQIEVAVTAIVESYKAELILAIGNLGETGHA